MEKWAAIQTSFWSSTPERLSSQLWFPINSPVLASPRNGKTSLHVSGQAWARSCRPVPRSGRPLRFGPALAGLLLANLRLRRLPDMERKPVQSRCQKRSQNDPHGCATVQKQSTHMRKSFANGSLKSNQMQAQNRPKNVPKSSQNAPRTIPYSSRALHQCMHAFPHTCIFAYQHICIQRQLKLAAPKIDQTAGIIFGLCTM